MVNVLLWLAIESRVLVFDDEVDIFVVMIAEVCHFHRYGVPNWNEL
jgi:hypothetical protein